MDILLRNVDPLCGEAIDAVANRPLSNRRLVTAPMMGDK